MHTEREIHAARFGRHIVLVPSMTVRTAKVDIVCADDACLCLYRKWALWASTGPPALSEFRAQKSVELPGPTG